MNFVLQISPHLNYKEAVFQNLINYNSNHKISKKIIFYLAPIYLLAKRKVLRIYLYKNFILLKQMKIIFYSKIKEL